MERLREFDLIRGIAALSVIAIHVTAGFVTVSAAGYGWNQAMRYAVPLFILLSGFLLYYLDLGRKPLTYSQFIRRRLKKIMAPYVLWTLLYVGYSGRLHWSSWAASGGEEPLRLMAKHLLMGTGYVHLYFLLIMLQLYLLYPLLRRWVVRHGRLVLGGSLLLTLLAQSMIYLHQIQVLVLPSMGVPYVSLFPLWIGYFVLGMAAASQKERLEQAFTGKTLPLFCCWLVSLLLLTADSRLTLTHASSIKPSIMLYTLCSFALLYALALRFKLIGGRIGNALDWLSQHSFFIFLLHPLVLHLLVLGAPHLWRGTSGMLALFLATTIVTVVLTHLCRFLPGIGWFGGVPAIPRRPTNPSSAKGVLPGKAV